MPFSTLRSAFFMAVLVAVAASFQSCKIMYVPNNQNVPMFQEKGEVRATVGTRNFQAAYAVSDHVGLVANGQIGSSNWSIEDANTTSQRSLVELGAGYFTKQGEQTSVEVYGGAGFGRVRFDQTSTISPDFDRLYRANMAKMYLQPSVSSTSENFDAGFSCRFVGLKFSGIDTTNYSYDLLEDEQINDLQRNFHMFMEPAITLRAGYKWIKVHGQVGYSLKLTEAQLNYNPIIITMGLHFTLANRFNSGSGRSNSPPVD